MSRARLAMRSSQLAWTMAFLRACHLIVTTTIKVAGEKVSTTSQSAFIAESWPLWGLILDLQHRGLQLLIPLTLAPLLLLELALLCVEILLLEIDTRLMLLLMWAIDGLDFLRLGPEHRFAPLPQIAEDLEVDVADADPKE